MRRYHHERKGKMSKRKYVRLQIANIEHDIAMRGALGLWDDAKVLHDYFANEVDDERINRKTQEYKEAIARYDEEL